MLTISSGPVHLLLLHGDLILAVSVSAHQLAAVLLVVVRHLLVVAAVTTLLARTLDAIVIGTMIDVTVVIVIVLVAQMIGVYSRNMSDKFIHLLTTPSDRDIKEDRDDSRENGTNGDDRKGDLDIPYRPKESPTR